MGGRGVGVLFLYHHGHVHAVSRYPVSCFLFSPHYIIYLDRFVTHCETSLYLEDNLCCLLFMCNDLT